MTEEQDLAALSFKAAAHDLELIVHHIAGRYIRQRVPLSWRLLHAIEAEALADLGFASRYEAGMRQLFERPSDMTFPETDDPIDFGRSNVLPAVFSFAVLAYEAAAASQNTPPHERAPRPSKAWGD
ncbi:DUF2471 family protein [Burkholderia anthina]|uniref:DUF2471 family protein n=1 Tax=Burkholderia anthina TaxID=179879 RepID=UPI0015882CDD|nr:DUF2471 family protein [Burkholderia anthina]